MLLLHKSFHVFMKCWCYCMLSIKIHPPHPCLQKSAEPLINSLQKICNSFVQTAVSFQDNYRIADVFHIVLDFFSSNVRLLSWFLHQIPKIFIQKAKFPKSLNFVLSEKYKIDSGDNTNTNLSSLWFVPQLTIYALINGVEPIENQE